MALGFNSTCHNCGKQTTRRTTWHSYVCRSCNYLNAQGSATYVSEPDEDLCLFWLGADIGQVAFQYIIAGRIQWWGQSSYRNIWMMWRDGEPVLWLLEWNARTVLLNKVIRKYGVFNPEDNLASQDNERNFALYSSDVYQSHSAEGELHTIPTELVPERYYLYLGPNGTVRLVDVYEKQWLQYEGRFLDRSLIPEDSFRTGFSRPEVIQLPQEALVCVCPNCTATILVYTYAQAVSIVCNSCGHVSGWKDSYSNELVLDDEQLRLRSKITSPPVPIGSVVSLRGVEYRLVGFVQQNQIGKVYRWREYVLFSARHGYAYLSEYDDHWCLHKEVNGKPFKEPKNVVLGDQVYQFEEDYKNRPDFAVGEFPYLISESAHNVEFTSPPYILTYSTSSGCENWMQGEYIFNEEIRRSFWSKAPKPKSRGAIQPVVLFMPIDVALKISGTVAFILLLIQCLLVLLFPSEQLGSSTYPLPTTYYHEHPGPSFVLNNGPLGPAGLDFILDAPVDNDWVGVNVSAINTETGDEFNIDVEVEYYYGRDEDGDWSEGGTRQVESVSLLPPGKYETIVQVYGSSSTAKSFRLSVERSAPYWSNILVAWALLALVPLSLLLSYYSQTSENE